MEKRYFLIEETIWDVCPKEMRLVGTRIFVKKLSLKKQTKHYNEEGFYQYDSYTLSPEPGEDGYGASAVSYELNVITEEDYRLYKKIIKKYNELEGLF